MLLIAQMVCLCVAKRDENLAKTKKNRKKRKKKWKFFLQRKYAVFCLI